MNIPGLNPYQADLEAALGKEREALLESEGMLRLKKENRPEYDKRKAELEAKTVADYVTDIALTTLRIAIQTEVRERKTLEANLETQAAIKALEDKKAKK